MCGITFALGHKLYDDDIAFVRGLLYHSADRGQDSTGAFTVPINPKQKILFDKAPVAPAVFLDRPSFVELVNKDRPVKLLVTHNRAATVGSVTKANAHPFNNSSLLGVHNGTVTKTALKFGKDFETDSEAIYEQI